MLNLRCLLGQPTGNVKRRLDLDESGVQETGLGWLFKAVGLEEIRREWAWGGERRGQRTELQGTRGLRLCSTETGTTDSTYCTKCPFHFYLGEILKTKAKAEKHTEENNNDSFSHLSELTSLNSLAYLRPRLYNQVIVILDTSHIFVCLEIFSFNWGRMVV